MVAFVRSLIPDISVPFPPSSVWCVQERTVRPGDLAPDDTDLGAANLLGCAVDESDLLAEVEAVHSPSAAFSCTRSVIQPSPGGLGVLNTLNLDQAGTGVGVALSALVAEVASPVEWISISVLIVLVQHVLLATCPSSTQSISYQRSVLPSSFWFLLLIRILRGCTHLT